MNIHDGVKNINGMDGFTGVNSQLQKQVVSRNVEDIKDGAHGRKEGKGLDKVKKAPSEALQYKNVGVRLEVEDSLHMVIAKIIDRDSGEVVRQIPPENRIKIAKTIRDIEEKRDNGVLIDREA